MRGRVSLRPVAEWTPEGRFNRGRRHRRRALSDTARVHF